MERRNGVVLASLGGLILLASLLFGLPGSGNAAPPGGERDVRVVNSSAEAVPVAVQGVATVAGSVTVANTPDVVVANTPANPVPVRQGAPEPFARSIAVSIPPGSEFAPLMQFTIPAGKVLVIETVSFKVELPVGQNVRAAFATFSGNHAAEYYAPLTSADFGGFRRHQATLPVKVHGDPGRDVWALVHRDSDVSGGSAWFNVAGHLVDAP